MFGRRTSHIQECGPECAIRPPFVLGSVVREYKAPNCILRTPYGELHESKVENWLFAAAEERDECRAGHSDRSCLVFFKRVEVGVANSSLLPNPTQLSTCTPYLLVHPRPHNRSRPVGGGLQREATTFFCTLCSRRIHSMESRTGRGTWNVGRGLGRWRGGWMFAAWWEDRSQNKKMGEQTG